jgi:hypothetical protein
MMTCKGCGRNRSWSNLINYCVKVCGGLWEFRHPRSCSGPIKFDDPWCNPSQQASYRCSLPALFGQPEYKFSATILAAFRKVYNMGNEDIETV